MSSHPRTPLMSPPCATHSAFQPLPPYLGARAHLSLSWLSQTFLSLILLIASVALLLSTVSTLVRDAKSTLTGACEGMEAAADVAVSMPHYVASGVNEMTVVAAKAVVDGMKDSLDLLLLAVQEIVIFMIEMYIGMYVCLLDAVVSGALNLVTDAAEEAESFIESAISGIGEALNARVSGINTALSKVENVVDKLGMDLDYQLDVSDIVSDLENYNFSVSFIDELKNLSASVPTYDDLKQDLETLISTPVSALRSTIADSLGNATLTVEDLPVPATTSVGFCSNLDTGFLDDVGHTLASFLKIAIGLLVLALVLMAVGSLLWEKWRYRRYVEGVERAREAWQLDLAPDAQLLSTPSLLAFLGAAENPTISYYLAKLANKFKLSPSQRSNMHWFGAYVLHPWAVLFLVIGCVGLVLVQVEMAALEGPVKRAAQRQASEGVGDFADSIVKAIDASMNETSAKWANETNAALQSFADGVNDDLFGYIDTGIVALNTTLATFYTDLTGAISSFLNGTVFEQIALDLVYCLIGSKITSLETALTYLYGHLHISMPTVPDTVLLVSPNTTTELVSSLTSGNSSVSSAGLVDKMVSEYARTLSSQRMGFILCIALWGIVLVMGLVGLWWRVREERRWEELVALRERRGLKKLSLGAGGKGEAYEMGEKGGRAARSSYQPMQDGQRGTGLAGWWSTVAGVVGPYLASLSSRVNYQAVHLRPHRSAPATADPHTTHLSATTPTQPSSFSNLRARVPRPTPSFRAARDALTRVLPKSTAEQQRGPQAAAAQPIGLQTWDPPTSPAAHHANNSSRMRAFLSHKDKEAAPARPPRPTSSGWQPLASPIAERFAVGEDEGEWPPSPPYRRESRLDPFADPGRMTSLGVGTSADAATSRTSLLLSSYPILQFSASDASGGAAEHPFAPTPRSENPFADRAAARGSGVQPGADSGLGMQVSGYRVGGSRRPVPPLREEEEGKGKGRNPFATPFDGEGEL